MFNMNICVCTCRNWSVKQFSNGFQTTSREDPKRLFSMDMYLRNSPALRECQGSGGSLLFNIYRCAADLHPMATRYNVCLPSFADLVLFEDVLGMRLQRFSTALTTISTELDSRGLKINCAKTSTMFIFPGSNGVSKAAAGESPLSSITCDGEKKIPAVNNTWLLGAIMCWHQLTYLGRTMSTKIVWRWIERFGLSGDPSTN